MAEPKKKKTLISHGIAARMVCPRVSPVTAEVTNRFSPTGGCTRPISMFTTITMPR